MTSYIGEMNNGVYVLRGIPLQRLIAEGDFVSALWLAWTGERPAPEIRRLLNACLVACIDHGEEPPSAHTARVIASCGKPLADAVAGGLLTVGERHGNAASAAARWIRESMDAGLSAEAVIAGFEECGQRVPGIGHPVYDIDPRTEALLSIACDVFPGNPHAKLAIEVARLLSKKKGKRMPVNVDGAIGAIVAALGADPEMANALFIVARAAGLAAHAMEQISSFRGAYIRL
jgi:citrate synthase